MDKVRFDKHRIGYDILNLVTMYVELDKTTRYYGTDVPVFHSEIHMISAIAERPGIHIGGLAKLFCITKGSVSEIIKKLERKDLVIKEANESNLSKLSIRLTEKGEKAHRFHMNYHVLLDGMVEEELKNASENEMQFLSCFLNGISERLKKCKGDVVRCSCSKQNYEKVEDESG